MEHRKGGFIQLFLLIIVCLVILGYFGYNVAELFELPTVKTNILYFWEALKKGWAYAQEPLDWLWEHAIKPAGRFLWALLQELRRD